MGFRISWIAFQGLGRDRVLEKVGIHDTGEPDEANEAALSGAEIPGGWFILFSNDFEFVSPKRLASLSRGCRIVACQMHEGVMFSGAFIYENGASVCEMIHDSESGMYDLTVSGTPPSGFQSIRDRLMQEQDQDGGQESEVDHIFDIPVEMAAATCGYRHDRWKFDWGEPNFVRLEYR